MGHANGESSLARELVKWSHRQLQESKNHERIHEQLMGIVEPHLFRTTLEFSNGHLSNADRLLGIHRTTLKKRLDEHHPSL